MSTLSATVFNGTTTQLAKGGVGTAGLFLNADGLRMVLYTSGTAVAATDLVYATTLAGGSVELSTASGYTRGTGLDPGNLTGVVTTSTAQAVCKTSAVFTTPAMTATAARVFRYFVIYDSTATTATCNLLMFWDNGGDITMANTDTLTVTGPSTSYMTIG